MRQCWGSYNVGTVARKGSSDLETGRPPLMQTMPSWQQRVGRGQSWTRCTSLCTATKRGVSPTHRGARA
eukprot:2684917-Rhodomonas_salina.1